MLRGKDGERIRQWAHDQLSVYGIGKAEDEHHWRSVFRQLVALGLARVDHDAYGALVLTEAARRTRSASPVSMDGVNAGLLAALKAWRLDEARTQSVPAYVILHDSTLVELARQRPDDLEGLADIPGFGARKVERYGDALVELIGGFDG